VRSIQNSLILSSAIGDPGKPKIEYRKMYPPPIYLSYHLSTRKRIKICRRNGGVGTGVDAIGLKYIIA